MTIKHTIEYPKRHLKGDRILQRITEEIPRQFNWISELKSEKIHFKFNGKLSLLRDPADSIKEGTIELREHTNNLTFICSTQYPNYNLLIAVGIIAVGLILKYAFHFPFSLITIFLLPLILYFGNWYLLIRIFRWTTKKVIFEAIQKEADS